MDTFLCRRNTNDNLIFGDTFFLEPLYQTACLSNDCIRIRVLLDVDESEVWAGITINERGAVLSELSEMPSQLWGYNARRNG